MNQPESDHNMIERRVYPGSVWAGVCMDEDLHYGPNVIAYGIVASGITREGGGNKELYADSKRQLVARVGAAVHQRLFEMATRSGTTYIITSHVGCGGAGAQGMTESTVINSVTDGMSASLKIRYLGQIPVAASPLEIGNSNITACISRPESTHFHPAKRVIITVGGGITQAEIREIESDGNGSGFIVSADTLGQAVADKEITLDDALEYLKLHLDIAGAITNGAVQSSSVSIFNAGRFDHKQEKLNRDIVEKFIDIVCQ